MPKIRLEEWGSTCSIYLVFSRVSIRDKSKACDSLEVISEAIEVIYAFWVDAEPSEVCKCMAHVTHNRMHILFSMPCQYSTGLEDDACRMDVQFYFGGYA